MSTARQPRPDWLRCLLLLALAWQTLLAQAETHIVSADGAPLLLQQALDRAQDGDVIELLPGDYRGQPLLLAERKLTLRGVGKRPVVHGDGKAGAVPALWTVRGGDIRVENIEFRGARAQDASGAAIRHEGGRLTVRDSVFFDNEHGILSLNDETAELVIENTLFGLAPRVKGGLPHLLNVGRIGKLSVQGSRFQQGFEGHMIKSRARESFIGYNFLHDGDSGGSSYEIDLPVGGLATVIGNIIGQSRRSQNRVLVAYGAEGNSPWSRHTLYLSHNTLINNAYSPAWFLRVWRDRLPQGSEVVAVNNLIVGPGVFWLGASGRFEGNRPASLGMLIDAPTYAFELPPDSVWRGGGIDPRNVGGVDLSPKAEFDWPMGSKPLNGQRSNWSPGAFQK
jgi:hypothetical protein